MRINILSIPVDSVSFHDATDRIMSFSRDGHVHHVVTVNPEMIVEAQRNASFLEALQAADLVVPDGVGLLPTAHFLHSTKPGNSLVLFLKEWSLILQTLFGRHRFDILKETVGGIDLTQALCEKAQALHVPVVFIGGRGDEAALAAQAMQQRVPGLKIASDPGPTDAAKETSEEYQRILALLQQHPNGLTFVAFGHPKQELWIAKHKADLPAGVFMGVGGTFTYLSGKRRRAHPIIRKIGLEWLWRLLAEPARWRRIATAFLVFPHLVYKGKRMAAKSQAGVSSIVLLLAGVIVLLGAGSVYLLGGRTAGFQSATNTTAVPSTAASTQSATQTTAQGGPTIKPNSPAPTPEVQPGTDRFRGVIADYQDDCTFDGVCKLKVGSNWIITDTGGDPLPGTEKVKGKLIGLSRPPNKDMVGKTVDVYAQKLRDGEYTLYGNANYYVQASPELRDQ